MRISKSKAGLLFGVERAEEQGLRWGRASKTFVESVTLRIMAKKIIYCP